MLSNYIKIALRNLRQNKSYTFINLLGLAVGMACCILISLYAKEELSFDEFHNKADRIVAVGVETDFFGRTLSTPYPLAEVLENEHSGVVNAVRLRTVGRLNLSTDGKNYVEVGGPSYGKFTEPSFFKIFSFDLMRGNESQALNSPNSIVLTEKASQQLFGDEKNPVGQSLHWQQRDTVRTLEVTGIVENPPPNSSIQYASLISYKTRPKTYRQPDSWGLYGDETFAQINTEELSETFSSQIGKIVKPKYKALGRDYSETSFFAIPLTELHLAEISDNSGFTGNRSYLYLFGSVALFILIIACINYVNLATARTSLRSQEVGVRKTLGGMRTQIAGQFLGEAVLLSVLSYLIGIGMSFLSLPYFNQVFGTSLEWQANIGFLSWLLLAAVGVGLVSGIYPALYLSKFAPVKVLRNRMSQGASGAWLRKTLVVGQFALALILIISALIVYKQLNYTQTKDLGFDGEQVVSVRLPNPQAWNLRKTIKNNLAGRAGVQEISVVSSVPGAYNIRIGYKPEGLSPQEKADTEKTISFAPAVVDYQFLDMMNIDLIAGRNFSKERSTDQRAYILNRKAVERLGWTPEEAVGNTFLLGDKGEIIGVVENYHIRSLREEIEPVSLQVSKSGRWSSIGKILARLDPNQISASMDIIENELKKYDPNLSFEYEFLDDKFDAMYRTERRLVKIVALFTIIAIVIACLGLYGLSAFAVDRRTKEIGIRKVLGADIAQIVGLLSKDFLKLVFLGFVIAIPVAWYIMNQWLEDFAYKIDIGVGVFVIAGIGAFSIALATVSWQSVRAAIANPVESLRSE